MENKLENLTGEAVRQELWKMMHKVQAGDIAPGVANALASQAREIVRMARAELDIASALTTKPSQDLRKFAKISGGVYKKGKTNG